MGMTEPGRYIQCFVYVRASPDDNFYAHPLDVVVVVELQTKRVLQWWHHKANPIIPTLNSNFHTKLVDQVCCTNVAPSSSLVDSSGSCSTDSSEGDYTTSDAGAIAGLAVDITCFCYLLMLFVDTV